MRVLLGLEKTEDALHVPLIQIKYKDRSVAEVASFFDDLAQYTALVFTSPRAVDAFVRIAPIPEVPLFSVGKKTTERLLAEGKYTIHTAKEENQEGVLHTLLLTDFTDAYIGLPCSSKARASLSIGLGYRGIRHQVGPLYDTLLHPEQKLPDLLAISELVFTSPSTVDAFARMHAAIPDHITCVVQGLSTKSHLLALFPCARIRERFMNDRL